jgi:hypothetical protein
VIRVHSSDTTPGRIPLNSKGSDVAMQHALPNKNSVKLDLRNNKKAQILNFKEIREYTAEIPGNFLCK